MTLITLKSEINVNPSSLLLYTKIPHDNILNALVDCCLWATFFGLSLELDGFQKNKKTGLRFTRTMVKDALTIGWEKMLYFSVWAELNSREDKFLR